MIESSIVRSRLTTCKSNVRAAYIHAAQSRLHIRRAIVNAISERDKVELRDLFSVLTFISNEIDRMARSSE